MGAVRQTSPQSIVFKALRDFLREHDFTDLEKEVCPPIVRETPSGDSFLPRLIGTQ
jgi:hypothetical protein